MASEEIRSKRTGLNAAQKEERERKAKEKKIKKKILLILTLISLILGAAVILLLVFLIRGRIAAGDLETEASASSLDIVYAGDKTDVSALTTSEGETAGETSGDTDQLGPIPTISLDGIISQHALMLRLADGSVVADKDSAAQIYPASLTKMMTVYLAVLNIPNLDEMYTVTNEDIDPGYEQGAAMAGFLGGETVPIRDLLYGTMLPSGAEACTALANIVAGSEADFVTMMNAKAQELGMNTTNFVNCTGLFDVNHVSSCADLAILLQTALQNSDFRSVFTTHVYTCTPTSQHATGLTLNSTLFSNLSSSTLDNGTTIEGGKTGYTDEAGRCLASMAKSQNGTEYILVTTGAFSDGSAPHISDAITIYSQLP